MYCQPTTDCLPHPEACLVTGITPQKALSEGLPEPEFFSEIYRQLAQPGTCGAGYNSIRFDDEVTRYGLYRNFYDPYEREWKHGNSRWDIIDMVRLTYALRPAGITWPLTDNGLPSFKLALLSEANGLDHEAAHDALSDVHATIALARLIKDRQPELYNYVYQMRNKHKLRALIDVQARKPLLHVSSRFSAAHGCAALVVPLLQHPINSNSIICYNLAEDPTPLIQLSAQEIHQRVYTAQADLPEGMQRIALKEIHLNKAPVIATPKLLDAKAAKRLRIDKDLSEHYWQQLRTVDISAKLHAVYNRPALVRNDDPEQRLYEGFINEHDRQLCAAIRRVAPEELASFSEKFKDPRLKVLLFRYRARHFPRTMTAEEIERWQAWRYQRLTAPNAGASIVLEDYFERLAALEQQDTAAAQLLAALYDYGDGLLG